MKNKKETIEEYFEFFIGTNAYLFPTCNIPDIWILDFAFWKCNEVNKMFCFTIYIYIRLEFFFILEVFLLLPRAVKSQVSQLKVFAFYYLHDLLFLSKISLL